MRSANQNLRRLRAVVFVVAFCLLFALPSLGQVVDAAAVPELVSIPKAVRPASASSYFGSTMVVRVDVDEKGRVRSVLSVSGPELACPAANSPDITKMREAAQTVALKARFKPAKIAGKAVASTATIEVVFPDPPKDRDAQMIGAMIARDEPLDLKTAIQDGTSDSPAIPVVERGKVNDTGSGGGQALSLGRKANDTVHGGVLNGQALSLIRPGFPPAAKAVRASGAVSVQVLIGEDGSMLSASPVSGHPLLRSASRIAACSSKFKPTLLEGNPVKVAGIITYNFVP